MSVSERSAGGARSSRLSHVRCWVFDLDNTLYPADCDLFSQIDARMSGYVADLLDTDLGTARRIQKDYFVSHGTTLRGLMDNHAVDPEHFLDAVHDIDVSPLSPAPGLRTALAGLEGRRLVFTNGSRGHAERVLDRLGIADLIDGIFDISAAEYHPKPRPEAYARFVTQFDVTPKTAVMIEDMIRNLAPAAALGMTTVWLRSSYQWAEVDREGHSADVEIDDLVAFLQGQALR
mgnify:CR=1 FL=1